MSIRTPSGLWLALGVVVSGVGVVAAQSVPTGPAFRVNTNTAGVQDLPAVQVDAAGRFVVVWEGRNFDASEQGVFGQRYSSAGVALGGEFQVSEPGGSHERAAIAVEPGGSFVVVWSHLPNIVARRFDSAGTPLAAQFQMNTDMAPGFPKRQPAVAVDGAGSWVVAWESPLQDGSGAGIVARRYNSAGAPLGGEFQVNTYTPGDQLRPSVAALAGGSFVIAWDSAEQDGGATGVFGQRYDSAGAPLGGEFQLNTATVGSQGDPAVAAGPAGAFVVTWTSHSVTFPLTGHVVARRYDATGTPLAPEFDVSPSTGGEPAIATDPSGGFVVAWVENSALPSGEIDVSGRQYDSAGASVGGPFLVNTFTLRRQGRVTVAATAGGTFLVAWEDRRGGVAQHRPDIFAQRFTNTCGDGALDPGEECDDGNLLDGDGCHGSCTVEECSTCAGAPSTCSPVTTCAAGDGCCAAGCTSANDDDCVTLVTGKQLRIGFGFYPERIVFRSLDPSVDTSTGTGIDPVADGAYLHVYNPAGVNSNGFDLDSVCLELKTKPGAAWQASGDPSRPKFRYVETDPVGNRRRSVVRDGRHLSAVASNRFGFEYTLGFAPQGSVAVRFKSGTREYCALFGGTVMKDTAETAFNARNAPAPAFCPPPALPCP